MDVVVAHVFVSGVNSTWINLFSPLSVFVAVKNRDDDDEGDGSSPSARATLGTAHTHRA
jgi:hypothetical protein|tara:strand:- start:485 stop:661 length:177 start_codon:yes stop_codon:yes gene_type:complete